MKYSENYTTRWHDTDSCHFLRPTAILTYMQETANHQCRDYNMDLNELYRNEGLGFLLSRIQLTVHKPIFAYEDITVNTWCTESKSYAFMRYFEILRGGDKVAEAMSTWALFDANAKTLVRGSDFKRDFPYDEAPDASRFPPRVRIPSSVVLDVVGERKITYSDIDFNLHMNNTKYPDMICDYLPDMTGKWVKEISVSYLKEAAFGDSLTVFRHPAELSEGDEGEAYLVRTLRSDGETNIDAYIRLSGKE
ncbi:MAG: hypothetical protein IJX74_05565 [Clostridia bacterium]|nr:hypothetical protein [Clostridia bacterium]